jgi:hypothetical protein
MIPPPLTPEEIAAVRRPYRAASLLPGRAYHDPAIHDFERERWFRRDWLIVGREEDAAAPGTYFLAEVDDEPLIVVRARDGRTFNLINKSAAWLRSYNYSDWMRGASHRFIVEVDPQGREKDEQKNEGDHHVILQGATLIRPQNEVANCAPDPGHGHGGRVANGGRHPGFGQVFSDQVASKFRLWPLGLANAHDVAG